MSPRYIEALNEVDYVINGLDIEDKEKIPEKLRKFINENKNKSDKIIDIENLSEEAYAILAFIYRKFLSTNEERKALEEEYIRKLKAEKESLKNRKSKEINYNTSSVKESDIKDLVIENKAEKWYLKLINRIKSILKK